MRITPAFKVTMLLVLSFFFLVVLAVAFWWMQIDSRHVSHTDTRIASGEWKIEVQTPPCESVKNLQVIWPKEPGAPVTIECDALPVPVK